jgi:hypothetical protein
MKYGEKNIVTGEVKFELSKDVRRNLEKCGPNGKYHELKKWKIF